MKALYESNLKKIKIEFSKRETNFNSGINTASHIEQMYNKKIEELLLKHKEEISNKILNLEKQEKEIEYLNTENEKLNENLNINYSNFNKQIKEKDERILKLENSLNALKEDKTKSNDSSAKLQAIIDDLHEQLKSKDLNLNELIDNKNKLNKDSSTCLFKVEKLEEENKVKYNNLIHIYYIYMFIKILFLFKISF